MMLAVMGIEMVMTTMLVKVLLLLLLLLTAVRR